MKKYVITVKDEPVSVKAAIEIIDDLIKDEEEAIAAYKAAIEALPQYRDVLDHILKEEIEHKEELLQLKTA